MYACFGASAIGEYIDFEIYLILASLVMRFPG